FPVFPVGARRLGPAERASGAGSACSLPSKRKRVKVMALKTFNPYTASRRFITMLDKSEITKETPEKALVEPKKRTGGRNAHGEITIWHRGGGHKKQYRAIDFRREKTGIPARV